MSGITDPFESFFPDGSWMTGFTGLGIDPGEDGFVDKSGPIKD